MKPSFILIGLLCLIVAPQARAQTASEIYLFDIERSEDGLRLSGGHNITNHPGYDNQPFFHPKKPIVYYSSFNVEGRSDIKLYDFAARSTKSLTTTLEREYSPTVTPDGQFISCIIQRDDGAQDLGKYPIDGGQPSVIIDNLIVGYHAWMSADRLLLFVLGDEMTLRTYDVQSGKDETLARNIGRSLHKIPGQSAMSFVHKPPASEEWTIKRLDMETLKVSDMLKTLPEREDLAWTPDGLLLMSDGKNIFFHDLKKESDWKKADLQKLELSGVTRLAVSADGKKLAVVAEE